MVACSCMALWAELAMQLVLLYNKAALVMYLASIDERVIVCRGCFEGSHPCLAVHAIINLLQCKHAEYSRVQSTFTAGLQEACCQVAP